MHSIRALLVLILASLTASQIGFRQDFFLVFNGLTTPNVDGSGSTSASANSLSAQTFISQQNGLEYTESVYIGPKALLSSTYKTIGNNQWSEVGNITFGPSHTSQPHGLFFSLISYQGLYDFSYGVSFLAGFYNVTGGFGAFRGAYGIVSVTTRSIRADGTFVGHFFGEVMIPIRPNNA